MTHTRTHARHASHHETWIAARAIINRGWAPTPRHGLTRASTLRDQHPRETRAGALIRTLIRTLSQRTPKHAAHSA